MFRTKVNEDIRKFREEGAIRCLRNLHQYVENVTYCDTQRFSYDEKGNIELNFGSEKEEANTVLAYYIAAIPVNRYPVHRSKSVNEFLEEHKRNIFVVDWPNSFGDIMPLEQLWLEMSIKFTEENVKAGSLCGLEREITSMWSKVCTDEFIKQLFQEIPVKLQRVVTNRG
ncbi:hypothetical protein OUZ56_024375 [Daphnia magna]|uniref:Uncharacterized protein n=1 Tax=Daphnia magna TaxID=35525 RepID=A0ABR0B0N6_9CRUS|nr:hypothetical protein OUZ56_024375 [Daphnia magna]